MRNRTLQAFVGGAAVLLLTGTRPRGVLVHAVVDQHDWRKYVGHPRE